MLSPDFTLGFKLNLWWRSQQRKGELPPLELDLYAMLADRGFSYFEASVGSCERQGELDLLAAECEGCARWGIGMSLHPYLEPPANPASMGADPRAATSIDSILRAAEYARDAAGSPVRVVLHPASMSFRDHAEMAGMRQRLFDRSREYIAVTAERAARLPGVRPMIEHQLATGPQETIIRIGDTYQELLRLVDGLDVGVCWDTGHYLLAVDRHGQARVPSDEFLGRVEHVHLHAVVDGVDHRAIEPDSRCLREYVRMLAAAGFRGSLTLEYSAAAILATGSFKAVLDSSLDVLEVYLA
jgi:sugar phosphate isomerase/epimerase